MTMSSVNTIIGLPLMLYDRVESDRVTLVDQLDPQSNFDVNTTCFKTV